MDNMKYRYIYEYELYRGTSAAETARRINDVHGAGVAKESTWVLYDNRKRSSQWLNPGDPAKSCPKRKLTWKMLLVSVWWTRAGVVHYSFLKSAQTITANIYCQQLQTIKEELAAKQSRLANRSRPLLLHDNARPHTAQQSTTKLDELQLECLRYPPYSPYLAPTDYHFFRNLDNFLQGKKFKSDAAFQTAFKEFIDSRPHGFF